MKWTDEYCWCILVCLLRFKLEWIEEEKRKEIMCNCVTHVIGKELYLDENCVNFVLKKVSLGFENNERFEKKIVLFVHVNLIKIY